MTVRYFISGQVQGVGFRYFVLRKARDLSLVGWVRNLPDGRVEAVARGDDKAQLALEQALRCGPAMARVTDVEKSEISDETATATSFEIK